MHGHIKVTKIYDDHKEVVVDDHNLLAAGMAVEIVDVLTGDIGLPTPIKPAYIQVGTSRMDYNFVGVGGQEGSSLFYHVSAPLTTAEAYGDETTLELEHLYRSFIASSADAAAANPVYEEMLFSAAPLSATTVSSTLTKEWFGRVYPNHKTKIFIDTFDVRLKLDKHTANDQVLTEFGLFSLNPFGYKDNTPLLLAYKKLAGSITKKPDFDLLIEWSIGFVGNPPIYDNVTAGGGFHHGTGIVQVGVQGHGWAWQGGVLDVTWQGPGYIPNSAPPTGVTCYDEWGEPIGCPII